MAPLDSLSKRDVRAHYRRVCRAMSDSERARCGRELAGHLMAARVMQTAKTVGLFAGSDVLGELSTVAIHHWLSARDIVCAYPRVCDDRLEFFAVSNISELSPSLNKICEPSLTAPRVPLNDLDVVLVPGLAFTRTGQRLGRGGGYYDRLLAQPDLTAVTIGVGVVSQLADQLPTESHDQKVMWVATEAGLVV